MNVKRASHEQILGLIVWVRGQRVILAGDIAPLYGVEPRAIIQAVKRNKTRFPVDFMFQLTKRELANLKSQSVISSRGGRRALPYAFTEQGVAMLSSVLRGRRAVRVNVEIMRAFVQLRRMLSEHHELARKLDALEQRYDEQFHVVFRAIRSLIKAPARRPKRRIGYLTAGTRPAIAE